MNLVKYIVVVFVMLGGRELYRYIIKDKKSYAIYVIFLIISSVTSVFFAFVLSEIFNCAEEKNLERLLAVLFFGVLFLFVSVSCGYIYGVVKNKLLCNARQELKKDLFQKLLYKNVLEFEEKSLGEYMNELQNNLNLYEELYFKNILQIPMVALSFIVAVIVCVYISPIILFVIFVIGVLISVMVKKLGKLLERTTAAYAEQSGVYASEIKDDFQGHRTICVYHLYEKIIEKHHQANQMQEEAKKKSENARTLFLSLNELAGLASTILIMAIAAFFSIRGDFSIGIVMAFGQLSGKIISPIMTASDTWVQFQSSKTLTKNYYSILQDGKMDESGVKKQVLNGDIELSNVCFSWGKNQILDKFSEVFERGKKYLIVGESGKGKSTLLYIIAGLYPIEEGNILVGGTSFREADAVSLNRQITLVGQDVFLFNESIRNNITLFDECSEEKLQTVIKQCGLESMIHELPEGVDTIIKENGSNFSGGEKQRLNLARALIKDSPIILLDEVTANLDLTTANFIEEMIVSLEGKTVISVSHKMPKELQERYDRVIRLL